jgi:hypothetical protein
VKVSNILDQIDGGSMALPQFQRGYVWNRNQVRGVMHSLYRGWPIGGLLAWITSADTAESRGDKNLPPGSVTLLLDGQQRVTTLYGIIRGTPPPFFDGNAAAFTDLYFNLEDEVFEFYRPSAMADSPLWINVTELMQIGAGKAIGNLYANAKLGDDLRGSQRFQEYINRLAAIDAIKQVNLHVEEVTGEDKTVDVVVEIFNLVNSGGTKLSKGDLALARIGAGWPEARDELRARLGKWRRARFDFGMDWLLRNINTIVTGEALFSALRDVDTPTIADGLNRAEYSIDWLLNLISSRLGLDHDRVLGGRYAFPVMSRYLQQNGGKITDHRQQGKLLYWYVHSFLWGRYAGSTESIINQDLAAIEGKITVDGLADGADPLDRLIAQLRRSRGNLTVRDDDFSGWSQGARFYPLLYLLTRAWGARDLCDGNVLSKHLLGSRSSLELHHVFPKAFLYRNGYDKTEVNALANFAFLTAECNRALSDRPPHKYFEEVEDRQPGALASQWIPMNRDLWRVENYRAFLAERRRMLADAANRLLEDLLAGGASQIGQAEEPVAEPDESTVPGETPTAGAALVGIAASEEDEQKLECAYWAEAQGLPSPQIDYVYADPVSGEQLAVFDLAWPEGIQEGLTPPVTVLLEEPPETEQAANHAGYLFFTSVEEFQTYAREHSLVEQAAVPSA